MVGGTLAAGVHDDPDSPPAPDAAAPRGWTWNRKARSWAPRQRGPVLWPADDRPAQDPGPGPGAAGGGGAAAGRDPDPGWMASPDPDSRAPAGEVPQEVRDDIAGFAGLVGIPVLAFVQQADPYCGAALADAYEGTVDAVLPLLLRSKKVVAYFTGDKSDWLLWGKLAIALAPVGRAFAEHHVLRVVEIVRDDKGEPVRDKHGRVLVRTPQRGGQGDHLQPPVHDEQEYAA